MELQVTKVKTGKYDGVRSYKINASSSDTCNLKIHSYIYGEGRRKKSNSNVQHKTKQHEQRSIQAGGSTQGDAGSIQ